MTPPDVADPRVARGILRALVLGSLVLALGAIALVFSLRKAAALTSALPPRMPMEQDAVFGLIALAILLGLALTLYLRALRRKPPAHTPDDSKDAWGRPKDWPHG